MPNSPVGTVLVTGAASGLGAAVVAAIRDAGGRALALDRVPVPGVPHEVVDLADPRAAEAAVKRVVDGAGGSLDAVFTAAGLDHCGALVDVDGADWDRVVMVNLLGTVAVVRAALPYLQATGGKVVTVAGTLGHRVLPDATAYCASTFGVVGFTRALQSELKGEVGVTLLTPGVMRTASFADPDDRAHRDDRDVPGPDATLNRPEDVAQSVLHVLTRPPGCEINELVVASPQGPWP